MRQQGAPPSAVQSLPADGREHQEEVARAPPEIHAAEEHQLKGSRPIKEEEKRGHE